MIAFSCDDWDEITIEKLKKLDMDIFIGKHLGAECIGLGIYDDQLREALGLGKPLKTIEERMKIMEQIRGVDFVFIVSSLQKDIVKESAEKAYKIYEQNKKLENEKKQVEKKKYEYGYVPGTYDLFHIGHLENLLKALEYCTKIIVGIKSDSLVEKHKNRKPVTSANERMEILRRFKFVYIVHEYDVRDPQVAVNQIKEKYGIDVNVIILGSDLKEDFSNVNIEGVDKKFTYRDKEKMKTRSTTAYMEIHSENEKNKRRKCIINKNIIHCKRTNKNNGDMKGTGIDER